LQGNDPIDTDYKRNIDAALLKRIKTKNLLLTLATSSDLPEIKEIEDECDEYFRFDPPSAGDHNRSLRDCLIMGDMIPGARLAGGRGDLLLVPAATGVPVDLLAECTGTAPGVLSSVTLGGPLDT